MKILVLNAGSSSVKYTLFDMQNHSQLISGLIDRIGEAGSAHRYTIGAAEPQVCQLPISDHQQALSLLFTTLRASALLADDSDLFCIGHRVVHGGAQFRQPVLIDQTVLDQIAAHIPLAPLHNPANLLGIQEAMRQMADIPQVAVFDTAFHQSMPDYAYYYALPAYLYTEHKVRRYGFHGASHQYVARQAAQYLGQPLHTCNLITLHLGNGASAAAIENGRSADTSMGMTPLEGLMMGSRCGDIDPAIIFYLSRTLQMSNDHIEAMLNKQSGSKGVCGENDMRAIHKLAESGNPEARLALEMYAYRLKKYIGAYFAVLNRVDAIVFTGGIGENDVWLREKCCENLSALGIAVDPLKNRRPAPPCAEIGAGQVRILVIATQEELEIAIQAQTCLQTGGQPNLY
ncbi:MAG: acetate kinase [Methylomonas sp.]|jgi:acetate kinase